MLMNEISTATKFIERLENPILAILLIVLLALVYILFRMIINIYASKEKEVKELNKILLEVRESDKAMLMELKSTIEKYIDVEKRHSKLECQSYEILKKNNEMISKLYVKIENFIKKLNE